MIKESLISSESSIPSPQKDQQQIKKTLILRYFGPINDGSLRGAIFAFLASAMGTGIFNLPLRAQQIGLIPFILFVFLGALFSFIGMLFMSKLIRKNGFSSYSQMSKKAVGNSFMRVAQFCLIIYPWGITICFQVIFAKFFCQILNDKLGLELYQDRQTEQYNSKGNLFRILINVGAIILTLPLSLQKTMNLLQKLSFLGVASVVYNFLVIIVTSIVGFERVDDGTVYNGIFQTNWNQVNWISTDGLSSISAMAQGMASILFCYVSHQLVFPLTLGLKRPSKSRLGKIIGRVHFVEFFIYILLGTLAYLLLIEHKDQHPIGAMVITSIPTTPVTIGKMLILVALFLAIPLNIFPSRESAFETFKIERRNRNHIILTCVMSFSGCLLAILFQQVNSYFGLLGGTAGVMMAGGIPSLCYLKLSEKLTTGDCLLLGISGVISIVAFIGAILSVTVPV